MPGDYIVLVHGTGARLKSYQDAFPVARKSASDAGIEAAFVACAWGDPLGVTFDGLSLPGQPSARQLERQSEDFAQWSWLFADPLSELEKLTIRAAPGKGEELPPGALQPWESAWGRAVDYQPAIEMRALLERAGLNDAQWQAARTAILSSGVARLAFERSAHELHEAGAALARSLVARLHRSLLAQDGVGLGRELRDRMVERLVADMEFQALAPSGFLANMLKRGATGLLKRYRNDLSFAIAPFIGDILLYQAHGQRIRDFIRETIESCQDGRVTVVAHSLGGIAAVDLLAAPDAPRVHRLVTVGSQAPLMHELHALSSLQEGAELPEHFPRWLNVYDRNDMLSYIAEPLFRRAEDFEADAGQPFPDAHSAYFRNERVWERVRDFMAAP